MRILIMFLMSVSTAQAESKTDWLCTEEASQRHGNTISACGIGSASTEEAARAQAFESAQDEYKRVCAASSDCKNGTAVALPQRTDCRVMNDTVTCYRLVDFSFTSVQAAITKRGKLHIGMTAKDVIKVLGPPYHFNGYHMQYYGDMCGKLDRRNCSVRLHGSLFGDNTIDSIADFENVNADLVDYQAE